MTVRNFVKRRWAVAVAVTSSLAIIVAPALLTGCGGGSARQQADVSPKAVAQTAVSGCPSCSGTAVTQITTVAPLPSSVVRVASYMLYQSPQGGGVFRDQSNQTIPQAKLISAFLSLPKDPNKAIAINFSQPGSPVPTSGGLKPNAISIGCLWMDVRWEYGYIPGCIKRNGWHLNFHFRNKCSNRELFNLHATAWQQNGPQFGLYESASGWCSQSRGTWTEIRGRFMAALGIVGVTGTAAYLISDVAAGITAGAFAL